MKNKIYLLLIFTLPLSLMGATYTCISSGDWDNASTWGGAGIPGASDTVIVKMPP